MLTYSWLYTCSTIWHSIFTLSIPLQTRLQPVLKHIKARCVAGVLPEVCVRQTRGFSAGASYVFFPYFFLCQDCRKRIYTSSDRALPYMNESLYLQVFWILERHEYYITNCRRKHHHTLLFTVPADRLVRDLQSYGERSCRHVVFCTFCAIATVQIEQGWKKIQ